MKHRRFRVSDHAVIRYLERVQGVDVEAARDGVVTTILPTRSPGAEGPW